MAPLFPPPPPPDPSMDDSQPPWSDHREARHAMVDTQIRHRGIHDPKVLAAMTRVPRHIFMTPGEEGNAYEDNAWGIHCGQTISQPYVVALMSEALAVAPHHHVLEIGTGSGYQTAILSQLISGGHVSSVERFEELSNLAQHRLIQLGISNVQCLVGDGTSSTLKTQLEESHALPPSGYFDRIMVTAASPTPIPSIYWSLLSPDGGKMVIPVEDADKEQTLMAYTRRGEGRSPHSLGWVRFVPLVGEDGF